MTVKTHPRGQKRVQETGRKITVQLKIGGHRKREQTRVRRPCRREWWTSSSRSPGNGQVQNVGPVTGELSHQLTVPGIDEPDSSIQASRQQPVRVLGMPHHLDNAGFLVEKLTLHLWRNVPETYPASQWACYQQTKYGIRTKGYSFHWIPSFLRSRCVTWQCGQHLLQHNMSASLSKGFYLQATHPTSLSVVQFCCSI